MVTIEKDKINSKKKDKLLNKEEKEELGAKHNALNETINNSQRLNETGFWIYGIKTNQVFWTEEIYTLLGCGFDDLNENLYSFLPYVHPDDLEMVKEAKQAIVNLKEYGIEYRIVTHNGQVRYVQEKTKLILDENNNPIKMVGIIQDITEKKELKKEVELNQKKINKIQRRFNALTKESVDVFEILDSYGRIAYVSEGSEKVIGYKPAECIGRKIYDYYEASEILKINEMLEFILSEPKKRATIDVSFRTKSGKVITLEVYMQNFLHDPAIEGILVNFRDVTSRVETEKRITYLSTHNQLTGLPNKYNFKNNLKLLSQNAKENNTSFAIFMLDIDSLAYIKNTLGYEVAEQYIINIAIKLKLYCGGTNFICHYSDNRFVIIIQGTLRIDEYEIFIKEIYELFAQPIKIGKYELDVDLSIGISTYNVDKQDNELLIRHAETALFSAKKLGKEQI